MPPNACTRPEAIWLYGLPGSGKTTLAQALARTLQPRGVPAFVLDGDAVRRGLTRDLGFSDADRTENIRRIAETAKLFQEAGLLAICACITPRRSHRELIREIIGPENVTLVHLSASLATCRRRDPKGLYARAGRGEIRQMTGLDSMFEGPDDDGGHTIDTQSCPPETSLERLLWLVLAEIEIGYPKAKGPRTKGRGRRAEGRNPSVKSVPCVVHRIGGLSNPRQSA